MKYNQNINNDPRSFFYYQDDFYINGTEITLTDQYINSHKINDKKVWKYMRFYKQLNNNGHISYMFIAIKIDWLSLRQMGLDPSANREYSPTAIIEPWELSFAIEEITKPIRLERTQTQAIMSYIEENIIGPKMDWEFPGLMFAWVIYIIIMIGCFAFHHAWILQMVVSLIFIKIRKGYRNE